MNSAVPRACALVGMAAVFLLLLPEVGAVNFPLTWRWSNPFPHGNNIIDVAGTDGFWVQVANAASFILPATCSIGHRATATPLARCVPSLSSATKS